MRYAILSDIHGNLEALEAALKALEDERIDKFLCAGDIVGYGADPGLCIKITRQVCPEIVIGNHDAASAGAYDMNAFNDAARSAIAWTKKKLTEHEASFLKKLEFVFSNEHLTMVHGTLQESESFHYMFERNAAARTFSEMKTRVCFVGHTHVAGIFSEKENRIRYLSKSKVKISKGEKLIVNAGSVGQPRDGDPRACFSVYDTDRGFVESKRMPYDVKRAQKKILEAGLPPFLAFRLEQGI